MLSKAPGTSRLPSINFSRKITNLNEYDALVEFYCEENINKISDEYDLKNSIVKDDISGKSGSIIKFYKNEKPRIFFAGLGKVSKVNKRQIRNTLENVIKACENLEKPNLKVAFKIPNINSIKNSEKSATSNQESEGNKGGNDMPKTWECFYDKDFNSLDLINLFSCSIFDNSYKWRKYFTGSADKDYSLDSITLECNHLDGGITDDKVNMILSDSRIIHSSKNLCRDLGNERADNANPDWYESVSRDIVNQLNSSGKGMIDIQVLDHLKLQELNLNLIYSVGQGALSKPRLVIINYKGSPNGDKDKSIALVGKGITFDTGGYNLKPTNSIETMYLDNCGAATVLSTIKAIAELKVQKNVIGVLCLAENSIGKDAILPSSIIKSYSGKTVEITNTDAEGRLVLADGLSYVQKNYNVSHIIDLATLTGACMIALGEKAAGLFSNDDSFAEEIKKVGMQTDEILWNMPILDHHVSEVKGTFSDLRNTGKNRYGGACTAAAFLREFIREDTKWVHLDIAGPSGVYGLKGAASGFGLEVLVNWLKK